MRRLFFFALASMWLAGASAQTAGEVADARILSFEESAAPFEASPGSTLSLSADHYKHGSRSVCWQWSQPGAQVRIAAPVEYLSRNPTPRETSVSSFIFWV